MACACRHKLANGRYPGGWSNVDAGAVAQGTPIPDGATRVSLTIPPAIGRTVTVSWGRGARQTPDLVTFLVGFAPPGTDGRVLNRELIPGDATHVYVSSNLPFVGCLAFGV